jgi:dephospho-CoA kinase
MKSIIIGLTGPIAAGKNTVAGILGRHGAAVIDADSVGHRVILPQSKAWHEIIITFGSKVLNRGGAINRKKLAHIVFSNRGALKKLNRITHPEMRKMIRGQIRAAKMEGKKFIVVNAAILREMKLAPLVDKVVVVLAKKDMRVRRLSRTGLSRAEALARINSQISELEYRKIADIVIRNDHNLIILNENVKRMISSL